LKRILRSGNTEYLSKVISVVLPLYAFSNINQEESSDILREDWLEGGSAYATNGGYR
jgi:hypothetical protein